MKRKKRKSSKFMMKPYEWGIVFTFGITIILLLVIFQSKPVVYELVTFDTQNAKEVVQYYNQYDQAFAGFNKIVASSDKNPAILVDGKIKNIRYGVVNFNTKTCQENTSFTMDGTDKIGYTNGCYGADGLFLGLSDDTKKVLFEMSGVRGWVSLNDVEIYNIDDPAIASVSHYQLQKGGLYHKISTDIKKNPAASIAIGTPSFDIPTSPLYSYDGHYFYNSYKQMADDERNNTHQKALNADQPYYNYYQYVSHRKASNYKASDINWYISDYLGYTSSPTTYPPQATQSLLYQQGDAFVRYQEQYGVNAIMMFALACNESSFGRSSLAIEKNNLFSHAAYDIDPDGNATRYQDASSSIEAHAKVYLSNGYLDPCDQSTTIQDGETCREARGNRYYGGAFGDKSGGMNIRYASDPYWGEKAAAYYRNFDEVMGNLDYQQVSIGVIDGTKAWDIFASADSSSSKLYKTPDTSQYTVVLLKKVKGSYFQESNDWYQIQSDAAISKDRNNIVRNDGSYDATHDVAYIPAKAIMEVITK